MRRAVLVCVPIAAAVAVAVACSDSPIVACHDIPSGGCPVQGGVECEDPTCAAAYDCLPDGGWSFAYACPARDGSVEDASIDAPPPSDAGYDIDAPPGAFGGPGCETLEPPDCPLGQALLCQSGCCDCEDLYVCDDGGWDPWGTCADGSISSL